MTKPTGKGHTAVRAQKRARVSEGEPWQKLELFPTPPWATRALFESSIPDAPKAGVSIWEPCAGLGHMAQVLDEYSPQLRASDVFNYPLARASIGNPLARVGFDTLDFTDAAAIASQPDVDWIVTNPPFGRAGEMLTNALAKARKGVAFLLRMQWLEGEQRYRKVFAHRAPTRIAAFSERVPMCEGGWDPKLSSATMYAWWIWARDGETWRHARPDDTPLSLIPPGRCLALTRKQDELLATRFVPGWVPPSTLKKSGREQIAMDF